MNGGWIKIFSKIKDWEWYQDSKVLHIFIHCLVSANFTDKNWKGTPINRGQFISSYNHISEATGVSIQSVRTALKKLEKSQELTIKTTNKYTLITVLGYDSYQSKENTNKPVTIKQQSTNKQLTTTEEVKKKREDIPFSEVIDFLNEKTSKEYKATSEKTKGLITARLNEKFTVNDFKKVITVKTKEWLNTENDKYLRPETLFGGKFEGYLNQYKPPIPKKAVKTYEQLMLEEQKQEDDRRTQK